ncbi:hypothetical protein [Parashewanella tropica]|uniref:hypothetical protein n=1 Tax=Parashewanella tropica TaxID=2547970 RepID=UPI0010598C37|nr:hypothetical protein [Parashewanella tropica]
MKLEWFVMEQEGRKLPEWARAFAIEDDGTVFVPGVLSGISEDEVYLCACYDATPTAIYKNHRFFPSKWLASEFSKSAEICEIIDRKASELMQTT